MDFAQVIEGLVASGPLAMVLFYWCMKLWKALEKERADKDELLRALMNPKESQDGSGAAHEA